MNRALALGAALCCGTLNTWATDLNLVLDSNGAEERIVVCPGAEVAYQVVGSLSDTSNLGLAGFAFDLTFEGGDLSQVTPGDDPEYDLSNFVIPNGFTNALPVGFGGITDVLGREGELVRVGGAQNTINNDVGNAPYPIASAVTEEIGWSQTTLAEGTLTAPQAAGDYTLSIPAGSVDANVIKAGETGDPFWATEAASLGSASKLDLIVTVLNECSPVVANLELFYAGRFRFCIGGDRDELVCASAADCTGTPPTPDGICGEPDPDPSRSFLAAGAALFCVDGGREGLACTTNADCSVCVGGIYDGSPCTSTADCEGESCPWGACARSNLTNITNYARGITGIRVMFNLAVEYATTADASLSFEWSDFPPFLCLGGTDHGSSCTSESPSSPCVLGGGTCNVNVFTPVANRATAVTVTPTVQDGVSVIEIVLADDHVKQRWLKITLDAAQVSANSVLVDGKLTGNPVVLPGGEGTPGVDAVFYLASAPGDVNGDRKITLTDVGQIRLQVNPAQNVPIDNIYDIDKSRRIQLTDVGWARLDVNPAWKLLLISP